MAVGFAGKTPAEAKNNPSGPSAANYNKDQGWKLPSWLGGTTAPAENESDAESARLARQSKQGFKGSENVEKKTEDSFDALAQQEVVSSGKNNVLNGYRSVTYNFTLAMLEKDEASQPEAYRDAELKYTILKSGGKGNTGITTDVIPIERVVGQKEVTVTERKRVGRDNFQKIDKTVKQDIKKMDYGAKDIVEGFNANSPGRFDMYINDVTIGTIMTSDDKSNSTTPTTMTFEVIEPYSMNGFIEALYVAALAAGYESYLDCCLLLKMQFYGYPDDEDLPEPEEIEDSTRYFPIMLTNIDVDVTERGTRYKCEATASTDRAFGKPAEVKKPIKMEGSTIGEILTNFIANINQQVKESDDKSKKEKPKDYDTYEIVFPSRNDKGELVDDPPNLAIKNKKLNQILQDNILYSMPEPGDTKKPNGYQSDKAEKPTPADQAKKPESIKYIPGKTVINFPQGLKINDAISSVIKDSEYVKDIIESVAKKKNPNIPDQFGFIEYFIINVETTNKKEKNSDTKKYYQHFKFLVVPYKVHYTRIPGYSQMDIKEETLKKSSTRTYNYIYTGQNTDVLSFKLNFNTLFFEAVPADMGNKTAKGAIDGAAPANNVEIKSNTKEQDENMAAYKSRAPAKTATEMPKPPVKVEVTTIKNYTGGVAAQPQSDPYSVMARQMHESVINSKASMVTGEMQILGDPFYLATGGIGNYRPKKEKAPRGTTDDGEVDHTYGSVLVTINFRNPIDYNSFEDGGMLNFDGNRVPFSGVYQVNEVTSTFKDGVFSQKLDIMRMPGQVLDSNLRDSDPADLRSSTPKPEDQVVPNQTRALSPSQRADSNTLAEQLGRGLPDIDTNFTDATGGLGGTIESESGMTIGEIESLNSAVAAGSGGYGTGMTNPSLLNQTMGVVANIDNPISVSSIVGESLPDIGNVTSDIRLQTPDSISSNVRLQASGLTQLHTQLSLEKIAPESPALTIASNVLTGGLPIQRAVGLIGGSLLSSAIESARNIPNIGSGIGKGATVSVDSVVDNLKLPAASVSNITDTKSFGAAALDNLSNIKNQAAGLVGGIGDKINALRASATDPSSIAATVGLDSSKLSGLGGMLQSKLPSQVTQMIDNVPSNVNLKQAADSGLVLDYISASKIQNIPATPPYTTAPAPQVDLDYAKSVIKQRGPAALADLYGVSSISKLSTNVVPGELIASAQQQVSNVSLNPFDKLKGLTNSIDTSVISDKINSAKDQLSNLTGQLKIPDASSLGSAAAKFGSTSLSIPNPVESAIGKDPTALSYSGTNPAVRARLGLPPLPNNNGWGEG